MCVSASVDFSKCNTTPRSRKEKGGGHESLTPSASRLGKGLAANGTSTQTEVECEQTASQLNLCAQVK